MQVASVAQKATPFVPAAQRPPTERQLQAMRLIDRGRLPPTIRELADGLGLASTNGVNDILNSLKLKGLIEREPQRARAVWVTDLGRRALRGEP